MLTVSDSQRHYQAWPGGQATGGISSFCTTQRRNSDPGSMLRPVPFSTSRSEWNALPPEQDLENGAVFSVSDGKRKKAVRSRESYLAPTTTSNSTALRRGWTPRTRRWLRCPVIVRAGCLPDSINTLTRAPSRVRRREVTAMPTVEVGVLNQSLASGACYFGGQRYQAGAAVFAKGIAGFRQGLSAVGAVLGLSAHGLLPAKI